MLTATSSRVPQETAHKHEKDPLVNPSTAIHQLFLLAYGECWVEARASTDMATKLASASGLHLHFTCQLSYYKHSGWKGKLNVQFFLLSSMWEKLNV